jgi:hypothetical protein
MTIQCLAVEPASFFELFSIGLTMPLDDPINVYIADTNEQAFLIKQKLHTEGIPAEVTEDISSVGFSWFGPISGINRPQIWVSRQDSEAAIRLLAEYAILKRDRTAREADDATVEIEIICDECRQTNVLPDSLAGSVQECRHCAAWLDVDNSDDSFDDEHAEASSDEE